MPVQVLIRKKADRTGNRELQVGEVLSENKIAGTFRLAIQGSFKTEIIEVPKSETISVSSIAPGQCRIESKRIPAAIPRAFPGKTALGSTLNYR